MLSVKVPYNAISPIVPETVPAFHVAEYVTADPFDNNCIELFQLFGPLPGAVPIGFTNAVIDAAVLVEVSDPMYMV